MAAQPDVGVSPSPASYDRVPPHNLDAEISVLGSMLLSRDAIAEVSEFVGPEDFYRGAHRTIYESARDLYDRGEPVDPITLTDELDRRGMLSDVGGVVAVADLVARVPTAANALYYARIVAEHALRRRLIDAGTQITRLGYQAEGADDAVDSAEALVYQVAQRNRGREFTSMKQLLTASFELIERLHDNASAVTGLSTGFRDFDQCTAGLQPANLVILAARPAMGKCLAGDAMVIRPDTGALQRLDEIVRDAGPAPLGIASLGPDGTLRRRQAVQTHDNGMRTVWRLCTSLGREIVATANHPLLTATGWVPLARLATGDRIATPRALPFFGTDERPDGEVIHAAQALRSSPGAQVPDAIFRLPRRQVALFLNRLLVTDCCGASGLSAGARSGSCGGGPRCCGRIGARSGSCGGGPRCCGRIGARSTHGSLSKTLAAQLQHLLLRFGIVTTRTADLDLQLADRDSAERFSTQIVARDGVHQSASSPGPGIHWDEIVSIEPAGEQRVYDLTVPGDHNFVAQDIIVHNSTLVTNIAAHVAVNERKPVVLFSLEMSQMELVLRILAGEARVDSERLRTGRLQEADWPKLSQAMGRLAEAPLFIDDTAGINLMEIRSKCRRLKQKHGLDLVVLDYLQLMQPTRRVDNRVQEVAELSRGLKILAKELNIPVIALSQLSRKPEDRSDRRPQLSDLRDSGCLTEDTRIARADTGAEVTMGELLRSGVRNIPVWSLDEDWQFVQATMTHVFPSGVKPVYEVRLASGRRVKATANHPFRTVNGWIPLAQIGEGSRIAVPRSIPGPSSITSWPEAELVMLAHLIGDGCVAPRQPVHYTNQDPDNLCAVEEAAAHFGIAPRRVKQGRWWHVYLPAPYRLARGIRNPIAAWLDQFGLYGKRSHEKFVPDPVFSLSRDQLRLFLRHLWATDGCLYLSSNGCGQPRIYYSSTSKHLVEGIQQLLLRFEIKGRLKEAPNGSHRSSFTIDVTGVEDQRRFLQEIGVHGARGDRVAAALSHLSTKKPNPNVDTIPVEVYGHVKALMAAQGVTHRRFAQLLNEPYAGSYVFGRASRRARIRAMGSVLHDQELMRVAESAIFWDKVVSVTPLGNEPVYDATVLSTHNFLANGIVVHNSIEQDADIVCFIYRDEVYDKESAAKGEAELIIAKHRNGPLSTIHLAFLGQHSLFKDMARGPAHGNGRPSGPRPEGAL